MGGRAVVGVYLSANPLPARPRTRALAPRRGGVAASGTRRIHDKIIYLHFKRNEGPRPSSGSSSALPWQHIKLLSSCGATVTQSQDCEIRVRCRSERAMRGEVAISFLPRTNRARFFFFFFRGKRFPEIAQRILANLYGGVCGKRSS